MEPSEEEIGETDTANPKVGRRTFLKYGGAAAVGAVASAAAYYFGYRPNPAVTPTASPTLTPTTTITPENPVVGEYGDKLDPEIIRRVEILGTNGLNDNERKLLDLLYQIKSKEKTLETRGIDSSYLGNNLIGLSVQDGTVSKESARALDFMSIHIDDSPVESSFMNYSLNQDSFDALTKIVSREDVGKVSPDLVFEAARMKDIRENQEVLDLVFGLYPGRKKLFDGILKEGIPDKRRQCTRLEAITWIYMDGGRSQVETWLNKPNPEEFLAYAWRKTKISEKYHSRRWDTFEEVTDRLTTPQFVVRYMNDNFTYSYTLGEPELFRGAEEVFRIKECACYDHSIFAASCLKKNGYDAKGLKVQFKQRLDMFTGHVVCIYTDPESKSFYTIDVWGKKDNIYGPFNKIEYAAGYSSHGYGLRSYVLYGVDSSYRWRYILLNDTK